MYAQNVLTFVFCNLPPEKHYKVKLDDWAEALYCLSGKYKKKWPEIFEEFVFDKNHIQTYCTEVSEFLREVGFCNAYLTDAQRTFMQPKPEMQKILQTAWHHLEKIPKNLVGPLKTVTNELEKKLEIEVEG